MKTAFVKIRNLLIAALLIALVGSVSFGAGKKKKKKGAADDLSQSAEPDKVLYDRAMEDYKHGRYTEERLALQTLINTYPDSEYLAKAKLAVADSYFREGGTGGLTESISEYKDFITFFPFLDEAAYAQMQVAMAHYRMMEKPDRDRTEAEAAEDEFQTFLLKFPQSPHVPQAEQRLREVQEVLAEGDYRVGRFYYIKGSYRAAASRLLNVADRYPLYSQSDKALWMLAQIFDKAEKREAADKFYARIVRDCPTSPYVNEAKKKLLAAGVPVPPPDPAALARLKSEKKYARTRPGMLKRSMGMLKTGPEVSSAAHSGKPNLTPPSDTFAPGEILRPGATNTVTATASTGEGTAGASSPVETVPAGTNSVTATEPPSLGNPVPSDSATNANNASPSENAASTNASDATTTPAAAENSSSAGAPPSGDSTASDAQASDANTATSTTAQNTRTKADPQKESSSKKKKGLHKIIPW